MIRAVIFDIGGVLEDTTPTGHTERWEATLGLAPGQLDRTMLDMWQAGRIGKVSEAEVHAALAERLRLSPEQVDDFMAGWWEEYLGTLNGELTEYFASLRPGYRTGILSNSFVGAREREQQRYGFEDLTDVIVYSHETGVAKPDPAACLLACERLGVAPEEAVFLDDREGAVAAARAVGMAAVLFRDNAQ
ncbi:MAG: HAD-IA family hydrolase, partial [Actinomycetota bacterium]|nr:HAD-IA family hydrolase [Actinomycetota bacterium]